MHQKETPLNTPEHRDHQIHSTLKRKDRNKAHLEVRGTLLLVVDLDEDEAFGFGSVDWDEENKVIVDAYECENGIAIRIVVLMMKSVESRIVEEEHEIAIWIVGE